jgi:DNA-binding GntR family transcriptional regulator
MIARPKPLARSDATADRLRTDILDAALAPGEALAEAAVAKRLGVSRVPVREALFTLEREGLVEFSSTGRAFVKELTERDVHELYAMRLTLEPSAARLAAPAIRRNPQALIETVAATAKATTLRDVTHLDLAFHELILMAAGNARLLRSWRALRWELGLWLGQFHRLRESRTKDVREETVRAHTELVAMFRTRTPAACEEEIRRHVVSWKEWLPKIDDTMGEA